MGDAATDRRQSGLLAAGVARWFRGDSWSEWLLLAAVAVCYGPLLTAARGTILDAPDFTKYFVPIHEYAKRSLLSGHWPLWNPYIYAGTPFAANPQTMVFYPPSWLYLLMPVVDAHRWLIVGHALLAALGMRLYLRRLGLDGVPVLVGSLPFALGGYFSTNAAVGHLSMAFAVAWLPFILDAYEKWVQERRRRDLFNCGVLLAAQFLAGEPQSSYYTVLLLTVSGLSRMALRPGGGQAREWLSALARATGPLILVGAIAMPASAVLLLPTLEMVRESDRGGSSYEFSTVMSMPLESLLAGLVLPWYSTDPTMWADPAGLTPLRLNREFAIYVGLIPLLLASLSLRDLTHHAKLARAVALVAVFLMLGSHTPLYRLAWETLPGLAYFRIPARANVLFLWAISVMSAFGMRRLQRGIAPSARWRFCAVAGLGTAMAALLARTAHGLWQLAPEGHLQLLPAGDSRITEPLLTLGIVMLAVLALNRIPRRALGAVLLTLTLLDLLTAQRKMPLKVASPEDRASAKRFEALRAAREPGSEPFRVDLAPSHGDALAAMVAGVENVNGYWPVSLRRFFAYVHEMRAEAPSPVTRHQLFDHLYANEKAFPLRLLNVRFASWLDPGRGISAVLEDLKPPPRAWITDRVEVIPHERQALTRLRELNQADLLRTVLLERAPEIAILPSESISGTVVVRGLEPEELRLATRSPSAGYLVVSLPFYPGWRATIDGGEVGVERADYFLTALIVPPGAHEVVLRYDPWTVRVGAISTLLVGVSLLILAIWGSAAAGRLTRGRSAA